MRDRLGNFVDPDSLPPDSLPRFDPEADTQPLEPLVGYVDCDDAGARFGWRLIVWLAAGVVIGLGLVGASQELAAGRPWTYLLDMVVFLCGWIVAFIAAHV